METFTVTCPYPECGSEFDVDVASDDLSAIVGTDEVLTADCTECREECVLQYDATAKTLSAVALLEDDDTDSGDDDEEEDEDDDEEEEQE